MIESSHATLFCTASSILKYSKSPSFHIEGRWWGFIIIGVREQQPQQQQWNSFLFENILKYFVLVLININLIFFKIKNTFKKYLKTKAEIMTNSSDTSAFILLWIPATVNRAFCKHNFRRKSYYINYKIFYRTRIEIGWGNSAVKQRAWSTSDLTLTGDSKDLRIEELVFPLKIWRPWWNSFLMSRYKRWIGGHFTYISLGS